MKINIIIVFILNISALIITEKAFSQPEGRHLEAIAYDKATQTVYLYGGGYFKDNNWTEPSNLWIYQKGKWTELNNNINPGNRRAQAMLFFDKKLYLYGGTRSVTPQRDTTLNDLWRWDGKKWEFVVSGPPLETPNLVNLSGKLLVCGYPDAKHKDFEIWEFKKNQFKIMQQYKNAGIDQGQGPLKVTSNHNKVITAHFQEDTLCIYSLGKKIKVIRCPTIPNRTRFGFVWQPQHKKYYLFGGRNETGDLNDFWEIDEAGNALKIDNPNLPEQRAAFSLLPTVDGLLLYGGVLKGGKILSNELFYYTNTWQKLN